MARGNNYGEVSRNMNRVTLINGDCLESLRDIHSESVDAVVTDPPYGLHEYTPEQLTKMRNRKG